MKPAGLRNVFALFLLCICMAAVFGCSDADTPEKQPEAKADSAPAAPSFEVDILRLEGRDWGYPSPFAHYPRGPGGFKMCLIFDSLLERDEKGLIPWLAESWSISDNGLTYRFVVRKNVAWHDGARLTADDVVFSINYANRHAPTWSYIFDAVQSVTAEDEHTVRVGLKQPHASMLYNLGRTRIIPKHIWEKVDRPKEFTTPEAVIGCGPYRLTDYSKAHGTYRFEAAENYWGPRQRVRVLEYIPVSEPILAYTKGEIDFAPVTTDVLSRFKDDPDNKIVRSPAFWGYRLLLNMKRVAFLRDVSVRRALAHAIDREELVEKIARGAAVPGRMGVIPPDHVMAASDILPYDHNPQKAGELLDKAGCRLSDKDEVRICPDGVPMVLNLLCASSPEVRMAEVRMAELIRQRLGETGIRVEVKSVDGKTRDARVRAGEYDLAFLGHGGWGADPDYLIHHLTGRILDGNAAPSHSGTPGFEAPELMDLLYQQQKEIDPDRRKELVIRAQRLLDDLVPEIPLFYTTGYSVFRPAKYDGWMFMFDHHSLPHGKLSYLTRTGPAAPR